MCAINGFNWKDDKAIIHMNNATKHRGPDGTAYFVDEGVSLGHNRLSIIDLSKEADQPMYSDDGELVLVFNGEIYNYKELKREIGAGYNFKTNSDSEVIIASYRKWGGECVRKFNGIFAFAIYDKKRNEIFLARDHAGIKPLYYFFENNKFIFSSEIKGILKHNLKRKLNHEALSLYFHLLYVPEPMTIFDGIQKFPSSHTAIFRDNNLSFSKYEPEEFSNKVSVTSFSLRNTLDDAVTRQLVSDRPVGLYLSGGIDSSIILDCLSKTDTEPVTFSVGFGLNDESEEVKFNSDFHLAKKLSEHYRTKHTELMITPEIARESIEKVVQMMDEPISNPTEIAMYELSKLARNNVAVALSGEGGDEFFGGYERYRLSLLASYFQKIPKEIRMILNKFEIVEKANIEPGLDRFARFMFQKDKILMRVIQNREIYSKKYTELFFETKFGALLKAKDFEKSLMEIDQVTWLKDEALARSDKMSMANGLEMRVPFLDTKVINFSKNMSTSMKISLFDTKLMLKHSFRNRLPEFILNQPKRGWFSPASKWLRTKEFEMYTKEVLSASFYKNTKDLFNWGEVESILESHLSRKEYNLNLIWSLLTFQIFARVSKLDI